MKKNDFFVNLDNARLDEQRRVMEDIAGNQVCPFCPEYLEQYHKQEILKKGTYWVLTKNQWPYDNTDVHLLAIATYHAEILSDLRKGSFDELQSLMVWAEKEFKIKSGGIAMRFGSISKNGATVNHLHAHLIVPSVNKPNDKKVKFKIG